MDAFNEKEETYSADSQSRRGSNNNDRGRLETKFLLIQDLLHPVSWMMLVWVYSIEVLGGLGLFVGAYTYSYYTDTVDRQQNVLSVSIAPALVYYVLFIIAKNLYCPSFNLGLTITEFCMKIALGDIRNPRSRNMMINDLYMACTCILGQATAFLLCGTLMLSTNGTGSENLGLPIKSGDLNGFQSWMLQNFIITVYITMSVFLNISKHEKWMEARTLLYISLTMLSLPLTGGVLDFSRWFMSALFSNDYRDAVLWVSSSITGFVFSCLFCAVFILINRYILAWPFVEDGSEGTAMKKRGDPYRYAEGNRATQDDFNNNRYKKHADNEYPSRY